MTERPRIAIESARPLEMPVLAALADALRDEGFHVEHSYPQEQRSIEAAAAVFVALRLLDVAGDEAIKGVVSAVREWMRRDLEPIVAERGNPTPPTRIYGPHGEVLLEVTVDEDDASAAPESP